MFAKLIVVSGLPCTGKTTIARRITAELSLPLIYKDGIKETLYDSLGWSDRAWSKRLSYASMQIMYYIVESLLAAGKPLVVEANFDPDLAIGEFMRLKKCYEFYPFEVHCVSDGEVLLHRFRERGQSGKRHPGHLDHIVIREMEELVSQNANVSLNLGGGFAIVDTTSFDQVDFPALVSLIKGSFSSG